MPYVAQNTDDDELTMVEAADPLANFGCPDCGATVAYVREHHRENTHGTVSAHFRYGGCGCAGVKKPDSTMSTSTSGGSGESQLHKERKWTALQAALNRYEHSSYELEKKIGDKRADAVLEFAEPHSEYGRGLVIEYQHKNEGKDIVGTERHFARHEYTTLWIWEDQFNSLDGVPDVDLFDGRVCTPWPYAVPERSTWTGTHELSLPRDAQETQKVSVPATFPRHWFWPTPYEHWEDEGWSEAFPDAESYKHERMMLPREVESLLTVSVPATIPTDHYDRAARQLWEQQSWEALFSPPTDYLAPLDAGEVPVEIDIAPFFDKQFWQKNWLAGKNPRGSNFSIPCAECGEMIYQPTSGEPVTKALKFHAKREHKKKLKRTGKYRQFIKNKHASILGVTDMRNLR